MSHFFKISRYSGTSSRTSYRPSGPAPPQWAPAPERSHTNGLYNEAEVDDFERAEEFCRAHPPDFPRLLASDTIERIASQHSATWCLEWPNSSRFVGRVESDFKGTNSVSNSKVITDKRCKDVCLFSNLPLMAGLYDVSKKTKGIYYEVHVNRMDGVIAIGIACKPYPDWRMPGWNRLSAGLHLDDLRKFFEDPDGGRDYRTGVSRIANGDVVGCGYEFLSGALFFTYNGTRLPDAFTGIYMPRRNHDVYAAIGVEGRNEIEVNFGSSLFAWKEGNDFAWHVDGHVGQMAGNGPSDEEELPSYAEARGW